MAVNVTTIAQAYLYTAAPTGFPTGNTASMTCFGLLTAPTAGYANLMGFSDTGGAAFWTLATSSAGTSMGLFDNSTYVPGATTQLGGVTVPVNTWWAYGVTTSGANVAYYCGPVGDALTVTTATDFTPPNPATELEIGDFPDAGGYPWNGGIAGYKLWGAQLTAAEIGAELAQITPVRRANLLRYHPFQQADTADYSGNGYTLSGGTGATARVDPPVPMVAYPRRAHPVARSRFRSG